jgi:PhnB protein
MSLMRLNPYLNFNGDCREAFEFYHQLLGGELELFTHEDMPMEGLSEDWKDKILHAHLAVDGQVLMGSDSPPDWYSPPQSVYISAQIDTPEEAERIFAALSEDGSIQMPLGEQPWAYRFGMLADRFGILWMVSCEKPS